jgi:hypothetical protein
MGTSRRADAGDVAIAGGLVGPRQSRVRSAVSKNTGVLPADLRQQIQHPLLPTSWRLRTALMSALVVDMILKI